MNFKNRIDRIVEQIGSKGLDGMISMCPENIFYLTNAPFVVGSAGKILFVSKEGKASLIVTDLDYQEVSEKSSGADIIKTNYGEKLFDRLRKVAGSAEKVGYEDSYLPVNIYDALKKNFTLSGMGGAVEKMREVKDAEEVSRLDAVVGASDRAITKTISNLRNGMTEIEAASEIEYHLRREGGESLSFDTIVASGPRAVYPHGVPSSKRATDGEAVVFDFGIRIGGYCSDTTRTFFFGQPGEEMTKLYGIVLQAQNAALAAARPGMTGKELDGVARSVIADHGYGKYYVHGTGHGVGIAIHEGPLVNGWNEEPLVPGNVVTIEPGIYIPKVGGVRIEDMILLTDNGCRNLTRFRKDMLIV